MKTLLILSLLIFVSCGKKEEKGGGVVNNPTASPIALSELSAYRTTFESKMSTAGVSDYYPGVSLTISSEDICVNGSCNNGILGQCIKYYSGGSVVNRKIVIDIHYWKNLSKQSREELMYHELGHCVLGRDHLNTTTAGVEDSIMNQYHLGATKYTARYDDYMAELFGVSLALFAGVSFNGGTYASTLSSSLASMSSLNDHVNCMNTDVHLD